MKKSASPNPVFYFILLLITSCTSASVKEKKVKDSPVAAPQVRTKPPATYQDTLFIDAEAAVFYHPDSLQLQKIKAITEERIFESQQHEFFFQMRNARMVLKKNRPNVKIIEAQHVRYLFFRNSTGGPVCIDLDTKNDPYGLFLFKPQKNPHPADMMNIDTEVPFYFVQ